MTRHSLASTVEVEDVDGESAADTRSPGSLVSSRLSAPTLR
jgi:hypothetical protein